ncbi:MAG: hypothetical protein AAGG55_14665 [Pseudomonadota bacterium]
MLVSVHLPKTAGTSFSQVLQDAYGDRFMRDYGDRPLQDSSWRRKSRALRARLSNVDRMVPESINCVHGHFLPLKYAALARRTNTDFITWLRHPVERAVSHYFYWVNDFNESDAGLLHKRVIEERWDLERFCLGPELRNVYSTFLWSFPIQRFSFVGITEHYVDDLQRFSRLILDGRPLLVSTENANQTRNIPSGEPPQPYEIDDDLRSRIAVHHHRDMALYESALMRRETDRADIGRGEC